ncbi:uncharacterized protein At4g18490-like isoform X4 [Syzygium oleosum]|uniref:uncharacterized protein At4g18490-like isoform X4 n=1 Tax=Syzygium oleosum TaxID=219896 RepID=UPI0024B8EA98|nr:uncharacterized protein At4g18490-like isoform X4 [Syzygium oleosum]
MTSRLRRTSVEFPSLSGPASFKSALYINRVAIQNPQKNQIQLQSISLSLSLSLSPALASSPAVTIASEMAESPKETAVVKRKEDKSLLEDDAVEFSFDTVGKGKTKKFNFDKLDVDFNLDADFDKLSSFKMDMPDLDFSSPSKKSPNNKDRNEAESTDEGNSKKRFSFSFDFNELDGFNLDSPMTEGEQSGKKVIGSKGRSSEMNEHQGLKTRLPEAIPDCEDNAMIDTVQSTCSVGTSKIQGETSVTSTSMSNPRMDDWVPKPTACRNSIPEQERTNSTCAQESDQQDYSSDETAPREVHIQHGVDTNLSTIPELPRKDLSIVKILNSTLGEEQSNREEMVGEATYSHGNMQSEGSSVSHVPGTEGEANGSNKPFLNTLNATKADNKEAKPDTNLNDTACIIPSKVLHDSEMAVFREPGQTHSKFFKRSEEIKSQSSREPSTGRKLLQFSSKRLASVHLNETRLGDNAKDSQVGGKSLVGLNSLAREQTKCQPPLTGSHISVRRTSQLGSLCKTDGLNELSKPIVKPCVNPEVTYLSKESFKDSRVSNVDVKNSSSLNSAKRAFHLSSLRMMRATRTKEDQLGSNPTEDISSMRDSEHITAMQGDAAHALAHHSKSTENQSLLNSSLKRKSYEGSDANLMPFSPLKRLSQSPSEKRSFKESSKTVVTEQGSVANSMSFSPLEWPSESPSEKRSLRESSQAVVTEQVCNCENTEQSKTNSVSGDHSKFQLKISPKTRSTEVGSPLVMETDENVEKAEAYTKELEDICNMLKKKQEEAKELLVRALVTNNNLLMLNHPIYEEQISFWLSMISQDVLWVVHDMRLFSFDISL